MTKPLVQGQIGYWVDGKLVYMPKRKNEKIHHDEKDHVKRNRERRTDVITKRLEREKLNKSVRQYGQRLSMLIEPLKNASKFGNIRIVLNQLYHLPQVYRSKISGNRRPAQPWTRFIFVPDIEERTALYYSSLTGHAHIVELYLCLYLMSCIRITKSTALDSRTFRDWFSSMKGTARMGLTKQFTLQDYDLCVLNALNEKVRHVLVRKKVTILDAMDFVKQSYSNAIPSKQSRIILMINARIERIKRDITRVTARHKKKHSKAYQLPQIKLDDRFDHFYYDDEYPHNLYDIDEEDTSSNTKMLCHFHLNNIEEEVEDISLNTNISKSYDVCDGEQGHNLFELIPNGNQFTIDKNKLTDRKLNDDFSITTDDQKYFEWEDFVSDIDSTNATAEDYDVVSEYNKYTEEENAMSQSWDVLSDLQSVRSVDTFSTNKCESFMSSSPSTSYRDALLKDMKSILNYTEEKNPIITSQVLTKKKENIEHTKMKAISEIDSGILLTDDHWERDGYKNARGGKLERFFKGDGRTQNQGCGYWYYRYSKRIKETRDVKILCRKLVK